MNSIDVTLRVQAQRRPESAAIGDREAVLGYADLLSRVESMAARMSGQDIKVLGIAADNSVDWVVVDLAARFAGIPVVPLPPFFSARQLAHVVADSGLDAIAADDSGEHALTAVPFRDKSSLTGRISLMHLERPSESGASPPNTAKISYTSGTTGAPKGVCISWSAIDAVRASLCEATGLVGAERHLCLLPLATLLENIAGVYAPLTAGAEIVVPALHETGIIGAAAIDTERLIDCLDFYRPHSVILLPQMLAGLVGAVERGANLPSSLRFVAVGGGVVGEPLLRRADRAGIPAFEGYGLTECSSVVTLNTPDARRIGSVGRPLAHARVRIGNDAEILVAGACMSGYLGDRLIAGGEIATGDIGYLDDDGFLYISGRKKNVLITSFGRNLSPEWVEASLGGADSIAQAALFGDGKPWNVAVIVPDARASVDDRNETSVVNRIEQAIESVNRSLPDYARIRRWILAPEPFVCSNGMATANGRLCRDAILAAYRDEIGACYADTLTSHA
jgi:long-subunit acyl-CoA synthetase (AMP-forming)